MPIVCIDAGHSYNTPGKRSPDGMNEYAFNKAAALAAKKVLLQAGITVLTPHRDDTDVSLSARTDLANNGRADLYVSIHANAFGGSIWNGVQGIETYIHPLHSDEEKKLAQTIHQHVIKSTKRPDRGVKTADFHVLRETKMPSVLVECGFMTNREEKQLLASERYRKACGEAIAAGILAHLGKSAATYFVQTGAFSKKENAEKQAAALKKAGFEAMIKS
ncbi:N-acetylmuramoyl-L-alanine amidase [Jeotgalibacillus haloalkalitolerans]|uniref:N-acetylmuramoyl-L-alanine amidase n=1 Tax=Jeotgalibacillus haloalkalitolerans TaxID=3104292 RepID=A0ABU5KJS4_9BACL|nr:N-acetylmuramoyl-L-alanine amidase [Jeotgalibacillus sp. HH7-29]MDZ5711514.1 N-acetylmuramoyl-L-alanine amidase [Jeotgalibacillus sp. HH7-29]